MHDHTDRGLDLDSHADMAVLGANCFVFEETGRTINVFSYDPKLGSTERRVVSGCFAYDDHDTGRVVLLIVHQGLHIPHLGYSLIPPFQMRENDVVVNDRPKFQTANPTSDDHALIINRADDAPYRIPLLLRGTTSYVNVRKPTMDEISNENLERFELTYETPEWEPGSTRYSLLEEQLLDDPTLRSTTGDILSKPSVMAVPTDGTRSAARRLDVVNRCVISHYEHEHSGSSALLASISPVLCVL